MADAAQTLAGRYRLQDVLGQGGMGVVYRARDELLDRTVAVKVLPARLADKPVLVERFEREARAAARLSHPNIVSVFDTGTDGTVRYIVMECVAGESLAAVLNARGALPIEEAVAIAAQVADALAVAHTAGIVHRDIKPGNVMIQPSGACKVLDFGIARAAADAALTQPAALLGSAPYMSPEMALGRPADARSDIYSLGCVLYEMLTDQPPFRGELPAAIVTQQVNAAPRPPSALRRSIPAALDAQVLRMLAKEPDERPPDATQAAAELRAALEPPTAVAPPPPAAVPPPPATAIAPVPQALPPRPLAPQSAMAPPPPMAPAARTRPAQAPPRRRPLAWLALALVALLVGVGIALAASSGAGGGAAHSSTGRGGSGSRGQSNRSGPPSSTRPASSTTPSNSTSTRTSTSTTTSTRTSTSTSTTTPSSTSTGSSTSSTTPTTTPSTTSGT